MHGRRVPWWSLTDTSAPASAGDTQCPAGSPAGRSQPKYMQDTKEKNRILLVSDVLNPRSFHREDRGRGTCGKRSDIEPVAWKKMSTEPRGTEKPPHRATAVPGRPCSPGRPERRTGRGKAPHRSRRRRGGSHGKSQGRSENPDPDHRPPALTDAAPIRATSRARVFTASETGPGAHQTHTSDGTDRRGRGRREAGKPTLVLHGAQQTPLAFVQPTAAAPPVGRDRGDTAGSADTRRREKCAGSRPV